MLYGDINRRITAWYASVVQWFIRRYKHGEVIATLVVQMQWSIEISADETTHTSRIVDCQQSMWLLVITNNTKE